MEWAPGWDGCATPLRMQCGTPFQPYFGRSTKQRRLRVEEPRENLGTNLGAVNGDQYPRRAICDAIPTADYESDGGALGSARLEVK